MPNTQAGLPLKDHLWKLPSLGTQPTSPRGALAFPRGFATGQIHCDELLAALHRLGDHWFLELGAFPRRSLVSLVGSVPRWMIHRRRARGLHGISRVRGAVPARAVRAA